MVSIKKENYTTEDIYSLPEGVRAELIDGQIYYMAPPGRRHQQILNFLSTEINLYIRNNKGLCEVYPAPFAVFLNKDNRTYVEPDISVICDPGKLDARGCNGAPDWIIEIVSPSSSGHDYINKLALYKAAGVREYWIVNPQKQNVTTYYFAEEDFSPYQYDFKDKVKVKIYDDFNIDLSSMGD